MTIIRYSEFDSSIRRGGAPVECEHKKDANRIDRTDLGWSRMFSPRLDDHHKDNRLWHSSLWFILLVFTPVGKLNSVIMLCHWQSYCGCGRMICKLSFETIIEYGNPSLALPPTWSRMSNYAPAEGLNERDKVGNEEQSIIFQADSACYCYDNWE